MNLVPSILAKALQERPQGAVLSDIVPNPMGETKAIITRSGIVLAGPSVPPPLFILLLRRSSKLPPSPTSRSFELPKRNPNQPPIPYPSILNKEKLQDKKLLSGPPKKLPEKLGDPGKFLIPCDFFELQECKFTFPIDFIIIDYDVNPHAPFILGRPFLRTARALVDVYEEELILRDGDEKLIFHADSTLKHPHKHGNESINMINFIDITCKDRFHEVLKIQKPIHPLSGNPTPSSDPMIESLFLSPTPFGDSDLLLGETDTLLSHFHNSFPDYEAFCFDIKEKSSGSTTSHSDHSLLDYEAFCFDVDHTKRRLPPADRSIFIIKSLLMNSLTSYLHRSIIIFYFDLEDDPGELTRLLKENIYDTSTKDLTINELNDFPLLLSDCDSTFYEEFSEIDLLVSFPSGNKDKNFNPRIFIIKRVQSQDFIFFYWKIFLLSHSIPYDREAHCAFIQSSNHSVSDHFHDFTVGNPQS
ncbi:reverse transcriptase domain-containing protein [Tanacetum coccineum]